MTLEFQSLVKGINKKQKSLSKDNNYDKAQKIYLTPLFKSLKSF